MRAFIMRIIFSDVRVGDDDMRFIRSFVVIAPTPADALVLLTKDWTSNVEIVDYVELSTDEAGYTPLDGSTIVSAISPQGAP